MVDRRRTLALLIPLFLLVPIWVGCGSPGPGDAGTPAASGAPADGDTDERSSARTLPIPGGAADSGIRSGTPRGSTGVAWTLPESWEEQTPSSSVRLAQFRVPGSAGDGECVVFYFGPGQGGPPQQNAERWAGQFAQPDGRSSTEVMRFEPMAAGEFDGWLVEVTGTYGGGMSGPLDADGYMLLGGIADGPDAPWFFKFIGPEATVRENRAAFLELMASLRVDD